MECTVGGGSSVDDTWYGATHKVSTLYTRAFYLWLTCILYASEPLVDPLTRYSIDYALPDQDFPGLQSNWDPPIDSGESSYVGTGRLAGRRALVTGGDS
jgi:hypothetical protein